jgi:hypothetical protein
MASNQAEQSRKIKEELGAQYKDKNFQFPTDYTSAEADSFAAIRKRMFEKREKLRSEDRDQNPSPDDVYENDGDLLEAALPTTEGQEKFWLWVHDVDRILRTMPKAGAAQDYFKTLAQTDFSDKQSLRALFAVLKAHVYPYIPAGSHNGYRYRIIPCSTALGPDDDMVDWTDTREVAAEPIIALNLVGHRVRYTDEKEDRHARRRADPSDESYYSSSSSSTLRGNGGTGFVCFQVGMLRAAEEKYWLDSGELPEGQDVKNIPWETTNWVLVVVIDANSTAGAVWLLQNFEPTIENTSDQYTIDPQDIYGWGYFEGELDWDRPPMQRAGLKIAHKITDLTETSQWTKDEYIERKYDIVQAVLAERVEGKSPVIIRQLPDEDDSSPDVSRLRIEESE